MYAQFERFEIKMAMRQAESASHSGSCDDDVAALVRVPAIRRQLDKIGPDKLAAELKEYGAWDADELSDNAANRERIVWIAAGDIVENSRAAKSGR